MATSQDFVNWVCGDDLNPSYLKYLLMAEQQTIRRLASGTTHQTMYYPDAKALWVCLPGRSEQDAVVALLAALDDKIDANARLTKTCEELAVSSVAIAPRRRRLEDMASATRAQMKPSQFVDAPVQHFSLPAFDTAKMPEFCMGTQIKSSKFLVPEPAVLVSKLNPHIPRVWYAEPHPERLALASTEFVVLLAASGVKPTVLWAACASPRVVSMLAERVTGTTGSHQRVKPQDVLDAEVPDPTSLSKDAQDLVDHLVFCAMAARKESDALAALRNGLLPPLLSGEIRVRDAQALVGDVT
jgi:type I restriction enzyme S subunit